MTTVYVLAQNLKEALKLRDSGCGYETRADAIKARSSPEIDSYYRNPLKIFELPVGEQEENTQ